ncbi:CARDB domain-containing protein [Natronosalvus halobius]|uniref:CARDB domain-containing protein n=1 Tax=Natronosalvus halobius TaxID=2953746 RepID=UPI00209C78E7|nr:CARDB domain-containing protein [Natronosalvus halobius]USZ72313.1 hypothetical protein NGM15_03095 [Natronosalvus halobius]
MSTVVGAVLMLGILVSALALYQVNVVPDENQAVEYEHNQQTQSQLQDLRNTIVSVPGGGSGGADSVSLGTSYPSRSMTVNPPPSSGTLASESLGEIVIENATSIDGDEVPIENWSRETYGLTYTPRYNEYRNAPVTVLEHGFLYNHHSNDATIPIGDQIVIDGDEIMIVTMTGNLSTSSSSTVSVETRAFSTSSNTVSIEEDNGPITMTLPTSNFEAWNDSLRQSDAVLEDSIEEAGTAEQPAIRFQLVDQSYSLRMAEVGVGDATRADAVDRVSYMTVVDEFAPTAIIEVRDVLNNPVRNVEITNEGDGILRSTSTGSDGQVRIDELEAGNTVKLSIDGSDVEIEFEVRAGSGSGGEGDGATPAYWVDWQDPSGQVGVDEDECNENACVVTGNEIDLTMETDDVADGARVDFSVNDTSVGTVSPNTGWSDSAGTNTTTFTVNDDAEDGDSVKVYTSSGSDGDTIVLTISREPDGELTFNDQTIPPEGAVEVEDVWFSNTENGDATVVIENSSGAEVGERTVDAGGDYSIEVDHDSFDPGEDLTAVLYDNEDGTNELNRDTATVTTVEGSPYFEVEIDDTNSPVVEGETLLVNATIVNTGDFEGTQTIELEIDGEGVVDSTTVENLAGGQSEEITLEWETEQGNSGNYTAIVSSENTSDSQGISVNRSQAGQVQVTPNVENAGGSGKLEFELENTGDIDVTINAIAINGTTNEDIIYVSEGEALTLGTTGNTDVLVNERINIDSSNFETAEIYNFDQNVPLPSGQAELFEFDRFQTDQGNTNMGDVTVTITLIFEDQSSATLDLDPNA